MIYALLYAILQQKSFTLILQRRHIMGKIIKGFWDCHHCGTTGIGGDLRECPTCGEARDSNTTFYVDKHKSTYVTKPINRNPDWICTSCNKLNPDDVDSCLSCGTPRTRNSLNYLQNRKKHEVYDIRYESSNSDEKSEFDSTSEDVQKTECSHASNDSAALNHNALLNGEELIISEEPAFSFGEAIKSIFTKERVITILGIIGAIFLVAGIIWLMLPKYEEVTVREMSWKRNIDIEKYQTVSESSWVLPPTARLRYTNWEFSHYRKVLSHYETKTRQVECQRISGYEEYVTGYRDLGNGYFEEITATRPVYETYYETETYQDPVYRDEPVYQTKYYYDIDKWLYYRSVVTSGKDKEPYWGDTNLARDERVSSQDESFSIVGINDKEEKFSVSLSYDDWNMLKVGKLVKLEISFGHGKIVE